MIANLVEEIEAEARADREARGIEPMGWRRSSGRIPTPCRATPRNRRRRPSMPQARPRGKHSGRPIPPFWLRSARPPSSSTPLLPESLQNPPGTFCLQGRSVHDRRLFAPTTPGDRAQRHATRKFRRAYASLFSIPRSPSRATSMLAILFKSSSNLTRS